jgi:UDP-N-acetylglucosamine 2-epimerase (non-hydrolysing)
MKIISVVSARPNFMKIAPFIRAIHDHNQSSKSSLSSNISPIKHILVHTGQHYDDRMSKSFFKQLDIPQADINLGVGSGTHAEQVGKTMIEFEKVLKSEKPDWVVVVGDVNATLACSVTAKKENIKCCHIEAGLRSGDMTMPEEINRLVTDRICDLLLTPDRISSENLKKEGVEEQKIRFVGNIMVDTLEANRHRTTNLDIKDIINQNLLQSGPASGIHYPSPDDFVVMTLHRPSNVDAKEVLSQIVNFITDQVCNKKTVIWTLHPRTKKMLENFGLFNKIISQKNLILLEPLSYLEMLKLSMSAKVIFTDSGGLQEECTILGTPCLTLRWNTERPVTLKENGGASILVGNSFEKLRAEYYIVVNQPHIPFVPELWDGQTAKRCLNAILEY